MVGVLLRDARERRGEDVDTVARELHIRRVYLEALEAGHLHQLPGQTYAVGFVRTYAEYLGLDQEEMVERLKAELGKVEGKAELLFPAPASDGGIPGGALIAISAVLAAIVYGAWYYASRVVLRLRRFARNTRFRARRADEMGRDVGARRRQTQRSGRRREGR
jgi:cytoskeleton protein RodZ